MLRELTVCLTPACDVMSCSDSTKVVLYGRESIKPKNFARILKDLMQKMKESLVAQSTLFSNRRKIIHLFTNMENNYTASNKNIESTSK